MAEKAKSETDLRVRDLMTTGVFTLEHNQSLSELDALMESKDVHHVPVVDEDDDTLIGIVSARDVLGNALLRAAGYGSHGTEKLKKDMLIKDVVRTEVKTIGPDATIGEAARTMRENGIGSLPVVIHDKLIGMLTATDLLELLAELK